MSTPISRCRHRDFYHHLMADHDDHCCVDCALRISYDHATGEWEVADMDAFREDYPAPLPAVEQVRAFRRLAAVMRGKRGAHPGVHPPVE